MYLHISIYVRTARFIKFCICYESIISTEHLYCVTIDYIDL